MASKSNKFYFDNFIEASEYACKAATFLKETFNNYNPDNIEELMKQLHEIEHAGDKKKHEMNAALAKAFVTPIDREDLALISENVDNVTDVLEEVLQRLYAAKIKRILPEALLFVDKLVECCNLMKQMLREFENFKKPSKLQQMIIELNHVEEECDELYLKSLRAVDTHTSDILEIIYWRKIYDVMEKCADTCEHVGDSVGMVVMKNT